jgi:hypothetical protein
VLWILSNIHDPEPHRHGRRLNDRIRLIRMIQPNVATRSSFGVSIEMCVCVSRMCFVCVFEIHDMAMNECLEPIATAFSFSRGDTSYAS